MNTSNEDTSNEDTSNEDTSNEAGLGIAIVGAGSVGRALGRGFAGAGHRVTYGVRDPGDPRHAALRDGGAGVASVADATAPADVVVLAVPADAVAAAIASMSLRAGSVLVDATNAVRTPVPDGHDTMGAFVAALVPGGVHVVKAFDTIGAEYLDGHRSAPPQPGAGSPFLPIAGDEAGLVVVERLATELGFDVAVLGDRTAFRIVEDHARLWIHLAFARGWGRSFHFEARRLEARHGVSPA
ncbi:MAG: NADPH-dependent F420 reductase [Actinomycetes bacterium]